MQPSYVSIRKIYLNHTDEENTFFFQNGVKPLQQKEKMIMKRLWMPRGEATSIFFNSICNNRGKHTKLSAATRKM